MSTTVTLTFIGPRFQISRAMNKIKNDKNFGIVTDVKLQRISFIVWHLQCKVELKG